MMKVSKYQIFCYLPGFIGSNFVSKSVFFMSIGINVFGIGGAPIRNTFMSLNLTSQECGCSTFLGVP